ncbi:hypothetical protein BGW80DRAFT_1337639, partial [Lactifluus volemus]
MGRRGSDDIEHRTCIRVSRIPKSATKIELFENRQKFTELRVSDSQPLVSFNIPVRGWGILKDASYRMSRGSISIDFCRCLHRSTESHGTRTRRHRRTRPRTKTSKHVTQNTSGARSDSETLVSESWCWNPAFPGGKSYCIPRRLTAYSRSEHKVL